MTHSSVLGYGGVGLCSTCDSFIFRFMRCREGRFVYVVKLRNTQYEQTSIPRCMECTFVWTDSLKFCGILLSGALAKLIKANIGVVMSVRLSVRNTWASDGRIFMKFHI